MIERISDLLLSFRKLRFRLPRTRQRSETAVFNLEQLEERTVLSGNGLAVAELVVFGDSGSDTGNTYIGSGVTIPPSPPYYQGRFTNGEVWVEELAEQLNVPAPTPGAFPPLTIGTNFAFGSARTGDGLSVVGTPNIGTQIDLYLSNNSIDGDELFLIWGGADNFFDLPEAPGLPDVLALVNEVVSDIGDHVVDLAAAGAQRFLIPNVVPLGQTPAIAIGSPATAPLIDGAVDLLNGALATKLAYLDFVLGPQVEIVAFDVNGLVQEVLDNPSDFGFTNTEWPVCPGCGFGDDPYPDGTLIGNPDDFVFWDLIHPTARGHEIIGQYAADAVFAELDVGKFLVDGAADLVDNEDGMTTLREAVELANRFADRQTIRFDDAVGPQIELTEGQLSIEDDLCLRGRGPQDLTISGGGLDRVFYIAPDVRAVISDVTITDGVAERGGGIFNDSGVLTLARTVLSGNTATGSQAFGGGIYNTGRLNVMFSQIFDNHALGGELGAGGGVATVGPDASTCILGSKIIGNVARGTEQGLGGGLFVGDGASLKARFNLIAGNQAIGEDGGKGIGGGIFSRADSFTRLRWNLIFGNFATTAHDNIARGG